MKEGIIKILKLIATYWKIVSVIFALAGAVAGGIKIIQAKAVARFQQRQTELIKHKEDSLRTLKVDSMLILGSSILKNQREFSLQSDKTMTYLKIMNGEIVTILSNLKMYDELFNFQQRLLDEVKKKE